MTITTEPQVTTWGVETKPFNQVLTGWTSKRNIARHYGVCERTIDNWIARKRVPYRKLGRSVRLNVEQVEAALQRFDRKAVL